MMRMRRTLTMSNDVDTREAAPDWSSVIVEDVPTPWDDDGKTIRARYEDPMLEGYSVLLVKDTILGKHDRHSNLIVPDRITTMTVKFPRFILPEWNTHRVFSRNSASSRARSIKTTVRPVMENPMIPLWTANHKGMTGPFVNRTQARRATNEWLHSRDKAVLGLFRLLMNADEVPEDASVNDWEKYADRYDEAYKSGSIPESWNDIHKQDCNRIIEPWMWHETLVTSTYWQNFLDLRIADGVQPEMKTTAILIRAVLEASPEHGTLDNGILHVPFMRVDDEDLTSWSKLEPVLLQSASECARISYHDRSTMKNRNTSDLGLRLLKQKHMSPFEHIAWSARKSDWSSIPALDEKMTDLLSTHDGCDENNAVGPLASNLSKDWVQFRRAVSDREQ